METRVTFTPPLRVIDRSIRTSRGNSARVNAERATIRAVEALFPAAAARLFRNSRHLSKSREGSSYRYSGLDIAARLRATFGGFPGESTSGGDAGGGGGATGWRGRRAATLARRMTLLLSRESTALRPRLFLRSLAPRSLANATLRSTLFLSLSLSLALPKGTDT